MTDVQGSQTSTGGAPPPATASPPSGGPGGPGESGNSGPSSTASAAKEQAGQVASTAAEQGKQTAGAAAEAGGQVASTAADGAKQVASEAGQQATEVARAATTQARDLAEEARSQLREQASSQTQRAASGLRELGEQVRGLSEGRVEPGIAADCARQIGDKISEVAGRLDERGFDGAVEDLRSFARRKPGVFLASAVAAGFVVGRLGRGAKAANQQGTEGQGASPNGSRSMPQLGGYGAATGQLDAGPLDAGASTGGVA